MNIIRPVLVLLIVLLPSSLCLAETLEEAWVIALSVDQGLQAVRTQTSVAESESAAAKSARLPVVSFDGGFTQLNNSPSIDAGLAELLLPITIPNLFSNDNFVTATTQLSVPLYTSGMISSAIDASNSALLANRARESVYAEDVKLAVAESFVAVLRAQRAVTVANTNVTSLAAHVKDVDNLLRKGVVPRNELLAVEVSLADARQKALRARNSQDVASAAYNRRLGRTLDSPVSLDEVMPHVAPAAMSEDIALLTQSALAQRLELKALADQSTALRYQADSQKARNKPQFAMAAGYLYLENNILDDETLAYAGVGFTWSVFDGGRTRHRANALVRRAKSVDEQRNDARSLIALQVRSNWLAAQEARERLAVTEKAIAQADENLRVAGDRYRNGIGTNTEVLDAETLRTATRSNHNNARYDAALARLRLARSVGVL